MLQMFLDEIIDLFVPKKKKLKFAENTPWFSYDLKNLLLKKKNCS